MRQTFFLDTNIYRKIARRGIRLSESLRKRTTLSYITYLELVSQLQRSTRDQFPIIQKAVSLAWQHGKRRFLPPPADFVQQTLLNKPTAPNYVRHSRRGLALAARIRNWRDRDKQIRIDGRYFRLADFAKEINRDQQDWIRVVESFRQEAMQHAQLPYPPLGGPITGQEAQFVNQFTGSSQWCQLYAKAVVGDRGMSTSDDDLLVKSSSALDAAARFVGGVVRSVLVEGYKFERKANDCFDHLQLQYLSRDDIVFVTNDSGLLARIASSAQLPRVVRLDDFLAVR